LVHGFVLSLRDFVFPGGGFCVAEISCNMMKSPVMSLPCDHSSFFGCIQAGQLSVSLPEILMAGMEELIRRAMGPAITVDVVGAGDLWTILVDPNPAYRVDVHNLRFRRCPPAGDGTLAALWAALLGLY
jgi:hypothetical protein